MTFPSPVKHTYLSFNGGVPSPYVFTNNVLDTVVSELLPLTSKTDRTAVQSYEHLVLDLKLVPQSFFPFAVDGGGDYFFVDCSEPIGAVYFYRSESSMDDRKVILGLSFEEFWDSLIDE